MRTETLETIANVSSKVTTAGAAGSVIGTFLINNMVGIIGLLIALAGYLTNAHYKRKANKRHAAEHELRMARLRRGMDSDTDLGTLGAEE
jgi:hypothetical protein